MLSNIWVWDPGSQIWDPEKNLFRIPDPGVKNVPDPASGSAKLGNLYGKGQLNLRSGWSPHLNGEVDVGSLHAEGFVQLWNVYRNKANLDNGDVCLDAFQKITRMSYLSAFIPQKVQKNVPVVYVNRIFFYWLSAFDDTKYGKCHIGNTTFHIQNTGSERQTDNLKEEKIGAIRF